jgi:hypothetical protein
MPHKFGEIPPPFKPDGNGRARPVRKISSLPEIGTVVVQVLLLNDVVAQAALGLKIITPLGTSDENALEVTVEQLKLIVAPLLGMPLALIWALNQTESPAGIAVPLKFDWMHEVAHGGHGVGVGVGVGQLRVLGEKVMGMVLSPTKVAEPEKVLVPVRGPSGFVIQVLKVPFEGAVK